MGPLGVMDTVRSVQNAVYVLSSLNIASNLWPKQCTVHDLDRFDYIIVGGGTAGCVLANRLSQNSTMRVLLIEAGGNPQFISMYPGLMFYTKSSNMDWNYTAHDNYRCLKQKKLDLPRGKVLGGSNTINFLKYMRGYPRDYDSWAEQLKDHSWNYSNVLRFFKKSESCVDNEILNSPYGDLHGTLGPIGVTQSNDDDMRTYLNAFKEIGYKILADADGNETLGYKEGALTIKDGMRQSTAYTYLSPIKNRPNLCVMTNSLVIQLVFGLNNEVIGVKVVTHNGATLKLFADKETIVSAGTINSPQLLMLSGIGPKKHLEQFSIKTVVDLPVGQNFQDHTPIYLFYKTGKTKPAKKTFNPGDYPGALAFGAASLDKHQKYSDYQILMFKGDSESVLQFCTFLFQIEDVVSQTFAEACEDKEVLIVALYHSTPRSRGQVLLQSKNPHDHPKIVTNPFSDKEDLEKSVLYLKDFNRVTNSSNFRSIDVESIVLEQCAVFGVYSEDYWRCYAQCVTGTMYDHAGTCSMGLVVDSRLRVLGVKKLRVVDASVMPTLPSGNINAATVMIAEKAADMIKEDDNRR